MQLKPLVEKNKRMNKKNEDLLQSIQRMEEKIKNLTRDNVEMVRPLLAPTRECIGSGLKGALPRIGQSRATMGCGQGAGCGYWHGVMEV